MDKRGFTLIELMIVIAILGILVALIVGYNRPSTIELRKDEWQCMRQEKRTVMVPVTIGKVTQLQPRLQTVCVEYRMRKVEVEHG